MSSALQTLGAANLFTTDGCYQDRAIKELIITKESFPIEIRTDKLDTEGRYVQAKRSIEAGEEVLTSNINCGVVFDESRLRICATCFRGKHYFADNSGETNLVTSKEDSSGVVDVSSKITEKTKKKKYKPGAGGRKKGVLPGVKSTVSTPNANLELHCKECRQVYFCSQECFELDFKGIEEGGGAHPSICSAYKRLFSSKLDGYSKSVLKLVIKLSLLWTVKEPLLQSNIGSNTPLVEPISNKRYASLANEIELLQTHYNSWGADELKDWNKSVSLLIKFQQDSLLKFPISNISDLKKWVLNLVSTIESNSFGLSSSSEKLVGRALIPTASFFNHSCSPNAEATHDSKRMVFHAIKPIEKGDPITISYIDETLPRSSRKRGLWSRYRFHCNCAACHP
ncbi:Histone-lysine N-methyltransferase set-6 [Entomophthora muscae]|uniref:Histone-lysine N-methyltransferase set-6 n=1 Tax=Entomophthora muscae TaxID=34485 RepID=A0ACC2SF30_9FUNG|nr:Histone-lysine N-methyltransferase set-6 [Entomophthora muscae]